MFEKYGFEGVFIAIQAVLTLYAQGIYIYFWHFFTFSSVPQIMHNYPNDFDVFLLWNVVIINSPKNPVLDLIKLVLINFHCYEFTNYTLSLLHSRWVEDYIRYKQKQTTSFSKFFWLESDLKNSVVYKGTIIMTTQKF